MECYVNKWGLYPWFEEHGPEPIHPQDRHIFQEIHPYNKVFYCRSKQEEYLVLQYQDISFRVKPFLFHQLPNPLKRIGDTVILNENRQGQIVDMTWHHKKGKYFYILKIEGKIKSKRYWISDFVINSETKNTIQNVWLSNMDRSNLVELLTQEHIKPSAYSLQDEFADEALCLRLEGGKWCIYYSERGQQTGKEFFNDEQSACQDLYIKLLADPTNRIEWHKKRL